MCNSCALVIQCYKFPLNHIVVKKRTLGLKKQSQQGKIYIKEKPIILHSCMLHHFTVAIDLLDLSC